MHLELLSTSQSRKRIRSPSYIQYFGGLVRDLRLSFISAVGHGHLILPALKKLHSVLVVHHVKHSWAGNVVFYPEYSIKVVAVDLKFDPT